MQGLHAHRSVESAAALAGGLASPAYRRLQAGWSGDRPALQADWSVVRASLAAAWPVVPAALAGGLVDRLCSACRRTGRSSLQRLQAECRSSVQRLQADWSVESAAAIAAGRPAYPGFQAWSGDRPALQADWSVVRAACGGLAGRAYSACRRTGRSIVQRLQADWSIDRAALPGGLVGRACIAYRRTGRSSVQRLKADWSIDRAAVPAELQ